MQMYDDDDGSHHNMQGNRHRTSLVIISVTLQYIRETITFDLSMNAVYAGRFVPILYIP